MSVDRVVLTGFMGSGKTTVGRLLAARLGWPFHDLDREVETHAGMSVPTLFAEKGEAHFRALETEVLAPLLCREHVVLALGGGAPEAVATRQLLQSALRTRVVYLAAPFTTLAERCEVDCLQPDAVARPLFSDRVAAEQRLERRRGWYAALAHTTVNTDGLAPPDVVHRLLEELRSDLSVGLPLQI